MVFVLSNWPGMLIVFRRGAEEMSKSLRAASGRRSGAQISSLRNQQCIGVDRDGSLNGPANESDL